LTRGSYHQWHHKWKNKYRYYISSGVQTFCFLIWPRFLKYLLTTVFPNLMKLGITVLQKNCIAVSVSGVATTWRHTSVFVHSGYFTFVFFAHAKCWDPCCCIHRSCFALCTYTRYESKRRICILFQLRAPKNWKSGSSGSMCLVCHDISTTV